MLSSKCSQGYRRRRQKGKAEGQITQNTQSSSVYVWLEEANTEDNMVKMRDAMCVLVSQMKSQLLLEMIKGIISFQGSNVRRESWQRYTDKFHVKQREVGSHLSHQMATSSQNGYSYRVTGYIREQSGKSLRENVSRLSCRQTEMN